jgi:integrase
MAERSKVARKSQPMHALRHTFASNLLTAGTPIFKVSKWLGHSSIEITVNRYGHLIPHEGEHEDVDRFAQ